MARMGLRRRWLCCASGLALGLALFAPVAAFARTLTISPLNGTPDASPLTQISFLGVPAQEISAISVVGSSSGRHSGQLRPYATAPGASFVPAHPFTQGEYVTVRALVGPRGHLHRVGTGFTVARLSGYRPPPSGGPAKPPAGIVQSFVSAPSLHPPKVAVSASAPGASGDDVFLTPNHGLGQAGPMILDTRGQVVWYQPVPTGEVAANLQVQSFRGQPVLVWWQGRIPEQLGVGFGQDEIYNGSYQPIATVSAGNGYQADLHDVQLTPQGSAFITAYTLVYADLSPYGGSRYGTIQDAVVQEIDVPTGLVMFEWHANGHVDVRDSYSAPSPRGLPWDFFHLNSISPDPWGDGDFIVSARNTWAAYEIDHVTGRVLWRLGGRRSSFKMAAGTGTAYQHDVRWQADRTLTVFDNGAVPKAHSQSRVIREAIDWRHRTVTLVGRLVRIPGLISGSQGNAELLSSGNFFVGWGEEPYFTEFSAGGQMLFDGHIPSPGESYRAYRFPWSATPAQPPSVAVRNSSGGATVYASWNGATGVSAWRVIGGASTSAMSPIATAPSAGFETAVPVSGPPAYLYVQALGAGGQVISTSAAVRG